MTENSEQNSILDRIFQGVTKSVSPEALGLSGDLIRNKTSSIRNNFAFDIPLADNLRIKFAGHVEGYCSNGVWVSSGDKVHDASIRAHVDFDIGLQFAEFYRHEPIQIYDRAFLADMDVALVDEETERKWFASNPESIFQEYSLQSRCGESMVEQYLEWVTQKLTAKEHDLKQVRVLFGEEVFDGHGHRICCPATFVFRHGEGIVGRYGADAMHEIIDAGVFINSPQPEICEKGNRNLKKRLDNPDKAQFATRVSINHSHEDMVAATKAIGMSNLGPFEPITGTSQATNFNEALLAYTLARHGIEPKLVVSAMQNT